MICPSFHRRVLLGSFFYLLASTYMALVQCSTSSGALGGGGSTAAAPSSPARARRACRSLRLSTLSPPEPRRSPDPAPVPVPVPAFRSLSEVSPNSSEVSEASTGTSARSHSDPSSSPSADPIVGRRFVAPDPSRRRTVPLPLRLRPRAPLVHMSFPSRRRLREHPPAGAHSRRRALPGAPKRPERAQRRRADRAPGANLLRDAPRVPRADAPRGVRKRENLDPPSDARSGGG